MTDGGQESIKHSGWVGNSPFNPPPPLLSFSPLDLKRHSFSWRKKKNKDFANGELAKLNVIMPLLYHSHIWPRGDWPCLLSVRSERGGHDARCGQLIQCALTMTSARPRAPNFNQQSPEVCGIVTTLKVGRFPLLEQFITRRATGVIVLRAYF